MWIHFRKIANFGAISKIEKYIKNQKSETFLNIQIYNFCRLSKNQYENFTNFVPPVKFSYWFSFNFYGFGIFYIFQIFCALAKSHSARFSISCSFQLFSLYNFPKFHTFYLARFCPARFLQYIKYMVSSSYFLIQKSQHLYVQYLLPSVYSFHIDLASNYF